MAPAATAKKSPTLTHGTFLPPSARAEESWPFPGNEQSLRREMRLTRSSTSRQARFNSPWDRRLANKQLWVY